MQRFDGDTVLVTGSTRGIGAGIARRFGEEGADVVVSGRSEDAGKAVAEEIRDDGGSATFVRADMRDPDDIAALVEATAERYDGLDVLVNNAAVLTDTGAAETTMDDWEFVVETDFRAYWLAVKTAVEHMERGSIVNISSNHSHVTTPEIFPYNAVKAGINGMTRAMALDLGPEIRVNTVSPGWVSVDRTDSDIEEGELSREYLESIHPTGRMGEPEDIAGVVAFIASEDAAFVTGAELLVDGGRSVVMHDDYLPDYRQRREDGAGW